MAMKKISLLFSFLLLCTLAFSQTIFLNAGPAITTDAPEGQPVLAYSFGVPDANGDYQEITLTMVTGIMSQALFMAASSGTDFTKMDLTFYDDQKKLYYKITMHDVLVTSYQLSSDLTENITLSFQKIKIKDFGK
jgi:hypothetical protein